MGRKRISDGRVSVRITLEQRRKLEELASTIGARGSLSLALRALIDGRGGAEQRSDMRVDIAG